MHTFAKLIGMSVLALPCVNPARAQEPKVQQSSVRENVRYVQIEYIRAATGGYERLNELLYSHYFPALRETGAPLPTVIHPDSGKWNFIIIWTMPGGMRDLEFHTLPFHEKAGQAILKKVGEAKAKAFGEDWNRLIVERATTVGHEHLRPLRPTTN